MEFLTKYAENICCICEEINTYAVGRNCDTHRICSTCYQENMDLNVQCKICPLFYVKKKGIINVDKPISIKFDENNRTEIVSMFDKLKMRNKKCLDKLKLYSCAICATILTIQNSVPLEICGHYVCSTHEPSDDGLSCQKCKINRVPITKVYQFIHFLFSNSSIISFADARIK